MTAVASAAALGAWLGSNQPSRPPLAAAPPEVPTETPTSPAPEPSPDDPAAAAYLKPNTDSADPADIPPAPVKEPELTSEDISIFEAALAGQPSAPPAPAGDPATSLPDLPALDRQYLAALDRGIAKAPGTEHAAWLAEAAGIRSGTMPATASGDLPPTLQKLRSVYLSYKNRENHGTVGTPPPAEDPAAPETTASTTGNRTANPNPPALPPPAPNPAETRTFDLHVLADDGVTVFLNGEEIEGEYLVGAAHTPGAIIRLSVTAAPGDTLGFHVRNREGPAYFAAAATSGVQQLFGSGTRWDSLNSTPSAEWLRGEGKPGPASREMRANADYEKAVADLFEKRCSVRSTAYRIIWPGGSEAGFRYRLRPTDLPKSAGR
jgi:hypothetical protein